MFRRFEIGFKREWKKAEGEPHLERMMLALHEVWQIDYPIKWAMEALDQQQNFEMPELPTELEDLVGDLLEQEEELFNEMEDVTSKAAASEIRNAGI